MDVEEESVEPPPVRSPTPQPAFEMPRTHEQKEAIRRKWQSILGYHTLFRIYCEQVVLTIIYSSITEKTSPWL